MIIISDAVTYDTVPRSGIHAFGLYSNSDPSITSVFIQDNLITTSSAAGW